MAVETEAVTKKAAEAKAESQKTGDAVNMMPMFVLAGSAMIVVMGIKKGRTVE